MLNVDTFKAEWRESARELKFFIFSGWVFIPVLVFVMHITMVTFIILVITIAAMKVIEYFGFTVPVAVLALRARLAGRVVKRRRHLLNKKLDR